MEFKTNWLPDDYFNVEDFNRISEYVEALSRITEELFTVPLHTFEAKDKEDLFSYIFFEKHMENMKRLYSFSPKAEYVDVYRKITKDSKAFSFFEWSMIEQNYKYYYEHLQEAKAYQRSLPFILGGELFD